MGSIAIGPRMWFETNVLGATLNYQAGQGPQSVLFRIGLSHRSLAQCNDQLSHMDTHWSIRDRSLSIEGDHNYLVLTFASPQDPHLEQHLTLCGRELRLFRWTVHALASIPSLN
jgi:hypothetical protein